MSSYNESTIQQFWNDNDIFDRSISNNQISDNKFVFYDGPPFATGLPHYGHILAGFIKDSIGRFQTQNGKSVPRNAGWDCHGLPIEYEIEKEYNVKTRKQVEEWGICNYNQACKNIVMKYSTEWKTIMNRLGRWVDFDNDYKTMDFDFMNSVWWVFGELNKKGLIYPSYRVMPYSVACKTPLSNFETQQNYQEVEDTTVYVKFKLLTNRYLLVWTTTPWTLPSNLLIAINKNIDYVILEDEHNEQLIMASNLVDKLVNQSKKNLKVIDKIDSLTLIGQKYIPIFDCYPIEQLDKPEDAFTVVHADFVTDSDGTGLVHIAPSYGEDDYQTCINNNLIKKTDDLFMFIDEEGYYKDLNIDSLIDLNGKFYKDGNRLIIDKLKTDQKLFFQARYKHSYPYCWRSDTPLMYRAVKSWFVNVESIKDRMVELNKSINWVPEFVGSNRFHNWLSNAKDWCIARNRYWGTPIPIWINIDDPSDYFIVSSAQELEELSGLVSGSLCDIHRDKIDHLIIHKDGKKYQRTPEVFDCWFESGSMPYASIGYPYKNHDNLVIPADFIAEGIDQTRGWFYTLLVISTALFNKAPFENVVVNGLIMATDPVTKKTVKMSKRLKNYPDPLNIVNDHGSDALRLYLLNSPASRGDILAFKEDGVKSVVREVIIPLLNSLKFLLEYKHKISLDYPETVLYTDHNQPYQTNNPLDTYAIKYIGKIVDNIKDSLSKYYISDAVNLIYHFVEMLNNQFIKFNRYSLKGKNDYNSWNSSVSTLNILLQYFAVSVASLIPFFSEHIFQSLNDGLSVHLTKFTDFKLPHLDVEQDKMADEMLHMLEIINLVNRIRSKNGIGMKMPLKEIIIESTEDIIEMVSRYDNYILDELNVLNYRTQTFNISNIEITVKPNYQNIKEKYLDKIKLVETHIKSFTIEQKQQLVQNQSLRFEDIEINQSLCNIIIEPIKMESFYSEYIYANGTNYSVYLNSTIDEETKILGYSKMIASRYQKMRKAAGLHPWDKIRLGYNGILEYQIVNEVIYSTCGYYTSEIVIDDDNKEIIYKDIDNEFGIKLYVLTP
jgi:isoleucyl-tRNA synthetase